jgi:hypothetical protein
MYLDCKGHAGEKHSGSEASDEVDENPSDCGGVHVEDVHQAHARYCQHPPGPDSPAETTSDCDEDTDDDGSRGNGEGLWEDGDSSHDGVEILYGFEI